MRALRLLVLPLMFAACARGPAPHRLTGDGVTPAVHGVLEVPDSPGPHPAVVIVPGSGGWRPAYAQFAKGLADSGFVALAIDYYAETGRGETRADEIRNWPAWQATIRNAVTYLAAQPAVAGRPIALVGYSRGAFLSISVGNTSPPLAAIVDFYGGGSDDDPPEDRLAHFPPLLILHGEADSNIPVALAHRLYDRLSAHGADVEMHLYPGAEHGFNTPWAAGYSDSLARDSWGRMIEFLRRKLGAAAKP